MKIIKSKGGYYYKIYKNGKKKEYQKKITINIKKQGIIKSWKEVYM